MRIRTANGVGLVRLWMVPVIVLVLVMSGSAAFGQQSGQVKNKKVGAATSKIIKEEAPPMRIMTDNSEPGGSNPGGGSGGGVQGGLGHLDVPAPPYFSSPLYFILPSPSNSPSGIGTPNGGAVPLSQIYWSICGCKSEASEPAVAGSFGDWPANQCDPTKGFERVTIKVFSGFRYVKKASEPSGQVICDQGSVCKNKPWFITVNKRIRFVNCRQVMFDDNTFVPERYDNNNSLSQNVAIPCGFGFGEDACE